MRRRETEKEESNEEGRKEGREIQRTDRFALQGKEESEAKERGVNENRFLLISLLFSLTTFVKFSPRFDRGFSTRYSVCTPQGKSEGEEAGVYIHRLAS